MREFFALSQIIHDHCSLHLPSSVQLVEVSNVLLQESGSSDTETEHLLSPVRVRRPDRMPRR